MKLEKMCVVCGRVTVPITLSKPGDPVCSCKCYMELQRIIEVMLEEDDCDGEFDKTMTIITPIEDEYKGYMN